MVSVRTKGDKIGVWLGDSNASESIITVGKKFKERLNIDPQVNHYFPFFSTDYTDRKRKKNQNFDPTFPDCSWLWSTSGYNETFWIYGKKSLRCLRVWLNHDGSYRISFDPYDYFQVKKISSLTLLCLLCKSFKKIINSANLSLQYTSSSQLIFKNSLISFQKV